MEQNAVRYPKRSWLSLVWGSDGWFHLALLVFGLALVWFAVSELQNTARFYAFGVSTTGTVTGLTQVPQACTGGTGEPAAVATTCFRYVVSFRFEASGQTNFASVPASELVFNALSVGHGLPLRYLPDDLSSVTLEGRRSGYLGLGALVLALIIFGLEGVGLWVRIGTVNDLVQRRDTGVERLAKVLRHDYDTTEQGQWIIAWRDEAGQLGRSEWQSRKGLPPVGSTITIYADPAGKLPSVWEGDCGAR